MLFRSEAGAEVTLVAGPVSLSTPRGVRRIDVRSARDMHQAVAPAMHQADVFIATAAVADWRVAQTAEQKIKKDGKGQVPSLTFTENPDILAEVAACSRAQAGQLFCVGFAAESHDLLANAQAKRARKGVPLLVGNIGPATFGKDDNALLLIDDQGSKELPHASKDVLARQLVEHHGHDSHLARALGSDHKSKLSLAIYAAAIPVAFLHAWIAFAMYSAVAVMWFIPDRRIERTLAE